MTRRLYAILDVPHAGGVDLREAIAALTSGDHPPAFVQLRAKRADTRERIAMLERIAPACVAANVPLVVDDDIDAALAPIDGVAGVHLGQDDDGAREVTALRARAAAIGRARFVVGLSSHNLSQLRAAIDQAPDYVGFGPVCPTGSKANPDPTVGFSGLADACRVSRLPVVAIGGLDASGGALAIELGAAMVAVIGALVGSSHAEIRDRRDAIARALAVASEPLALDEVQRRIPVLSADALTEIARWADDYGVLAGLRLPARFRPIWRNGEPRYRPSDVHDLVAALGKHADESWAQWSARGDPGGSDPLVRLRRAP
ncbi:MAG TPA: thiamine phosphate synthase [Nannocystaceae bacterium]|nr:thiamine phosphate synthase [Nannocystaceae bacterium]